MAPIFRYFARVLQRSTARRNCFPNERTCDQPFFEDRLSRSSFRRNSFEYPPLNRDINTVLKDAPPTYTYTPMCLSNVNISMMLFGEAPPDHFSHECWLEEHLHRFGNLNGLSMYENDSVSSEADFDEILSSESETLSDIMITRTDDVVSLQGSVDSIESTTSEVLDMLDRAITDGSNDCPPPYSEIDYDTTPTGRIESPPSYFDIFGSNSVNSHSDSDSENTIYSQRAITSQTGPGNGYGVANMLFWNSDFLY